MDISELPYSLISFFLSPTIQPTIEPISFHRKPNARSPKICSDSRIYVGGSSATFPSFFLRLEFSYKGVHRKVQGKSPLKANNLYFSQQFPNRGDHFVRFRHEFMSEKRVWKEVSNFHKLTGSNLHDGVWLPRPSGRL